MPFAELPGSHISGLVTPDWSQFAHQANAEIMQGAELRARAGENLANSVLQASNQINEILKMASPEGRLERALHHEQLAAMLHTYQDYHAHPENYLLTAHGPVHKDPETELLKGLHIKQAVGSIILNNQKIKDAQSAGDTADFITGLRKKAAGFFGSSDYNNLPVKTPSEPPDIGGSQSPEAPKVDAETLSQPGSELFNNPGENE